MENYSNLPETISRLSINAVLVATAILVVLSAVSLGIKHPGAVFKKVLFAGFVAVTILCTLFLASATIYLNGVSASGGPVHHHADFEIWQCAKELEFADPHGLSNKIGTATLHEHNDKRIHIEGVIVKPQDASLGNFFNVAGGKLERNSLTIPTDEGTVTLKSGDLCRGKSTQLQVFVFRVRGKYFSQTKISDPAAYVIAPENNVPPGDCVIFELDLPKVRTDKLCKSFRVALQSGKLQRELKF